MNKYGYRLTVYQNLNPLLGSSRGCNLETICRNTGVKKSKHVCNIYKIQLESYAKDE
jgi:hypothetical protein